MSKIIENIPELCLLCKGKKICPCGNNNCENLLSLDLSSFNTENVVDMSLMFSSCTNLYSFDSSQFNMKNVNDKTTDYENRVLCCLSSFS